MFPPEAPAQLDDARRDAEAFGIPPEAFAAFDDPDLGDANEDGADNQHGTGTGTGADTEVFEVYEDNMPTVEAFLALQTQWRYVSGMRAIRTGFDYNVVPGVFTLLGIPAADHAEVFAGVRVMELAALNICAQRAQND